MLTCGDTLTNTGDANISNFKHRFGIAPSHDAPSKIPPTHRDAAQLTRVQPAAMPLAKT